MPQTVKNAFDEGSSLPPKDWPPFTRAATTTDLPLHVQVSEMLAREIKAGLLPDGARLQPEREMAQDLGIAVGTLRKALADLTEKGLLERVHGSGNYVRNNANAQTIYSFFRLERIGGGGLPGAELISVDQLDRPEDIPKMSEAHHIFRIRRIRLLDGSPVALEEIWLDGSHARTLEASNLKQSLYDYYRTELGLIITRAEDQVSVAAPPSWKPEAMGSTARIWGYVERTSFDQHNNAAEFSRTWFDPRICRFVARWS